MHWGLPQDPQQLAQLNLVAKAAQLYWSSPGHPGWMVEHLPQESSHDVDLLALGNEFSVTADHRCEGLQREVSFATKASLTALLCSQYNGSM